MKLLQSANKDNTLDGFRYEENLLYSGFKNRFIQIYFQKCYLVYRRLYHMLFLGVYQIKVFDIFQN